MAWVVLGGGPAFSAPQRVIVYATEGVDKALTVGLATYLSNTVYIAADTRPAGAWTGAVGAGAARAFIAAQSGAGATGSNDVHLILVDVPGPAATNGPLLIKDARLAVVNVSTWKPADPVAAAADGSWHARHNRDVAATAAYLLGMPVCPFPLCLLYKHECIEDMDMKPLGLCPPCQDILQRKLCKPE